MTTEIRRRYLQCRFLILYASDSEIVSMNVRVLVGHCFGALLEHFDVRYEDCVFHFLL